MNARHLVRIEPHHVQIDMPVLLDIYSSEGKLLLGRGLAVHRLEIVDRLHQEGFKLANGSVGIAAVRDPVFRRIGAVADQLNPIERALDEHHGIDSFVSRIQSLAQTVLDCCDEDSDAALAQPYLNCYHPYSVLHHILVAVIVTVLSKAQEWSDSERLSLTCAALTHDLGVLSGQAELAHAGPLTAAQRVFVHGHSLGAVELLKSLGVRDPLWLQAVLQHHETLDGSGYPSGVCIGLHSPAALMSVSDGFAAMMRPRAYRNRKLGNDIIEDLRAHAGSLYSPVLVEALATHIGSYHAGSILRLVSGDMAVVTRHRYETPLTPDLTVLASCGDQPLERPYGVDSADPEFAIKTVLHPEISLSFRNVVNRVWGG